MRNSFFMSPIKPIHPRFKQSRLQLAIQAASLGLSVAITGQVFAADKQDVIELEELEVSAPRISDQATQGYQTKKSRTATKTETDLIDVPQSITVITPELMKDMSIQSMSEAVQYVPGVQFSQGEGNRDAVNFRGAGVVTGDFFLDGVRDDIETYRDFYNTERIEVLKGSNAMIFGRGGSGGVINRVSKEASWSPTRALSLSYGAFDHRRATIDIGDSMSESVAFRMNAVAEDSDSYRDGVNIERYGITPTFTIKPSESAKIVISAEYFDDKHIGDRGQASVRSNSSVGVNYKNRPFDISNEDQVFGSARLSPNGTETTAFNVMFENVFNNGITLRNRTRYANYDKFYENVFASSSVNPANGNFTFSAYRNDTDRENLINQTDLTYTLKLGSVEHQLLGGIELAKQDTRDIRRVQNGSETIGTLNVSSPVYTGSINYNGKSRDRQSDTDITAFYLQDQITLSPQWQVILGARHDKFAVDFTNLLNGDRIQTTDNKVSPRAGLIFKPIENLSLYASYSQTFVPRAGDQLNGLTVTNAALSPEKFINHEIGAKFDLTPALSLSAAVYQLQREDMAITDPNNVSSTILVDGQESKGVEFGISGNITDQWSMFGGVAVQKGEITEQQGASTSAILKGAETAQTPRRTFSLWNRYDINAIWGVALGIVSRSAMYAAVPTASQSTILPGFTRYDAAIYAKLSDQLQLQINLENLTNKEYAASAHNNNNIVPGSPLTGRATLTYNF
jgi:catecholate siderophore receptor